MDSSERGNAPHEALLPPAEPWGVESWNEHQRAVLESLEHMDSGDGFPNQDVAVVMPPGTGKTLLGFYWLKQQLMLNTLDGQGVGLYVVPFRALCHQTHQVAQSIPALAGADVRKVVGGSDGSGATIGSDRPIIVCTPEKALQILARGRLRGPAFVVLDEAHLRYDRQRGWTYDAVRAASCVKSVMYMTATAGNALLDWMDNGGETQLLGKPLSTSVTVPKIIVEECAWPTTESLAKLVSEKHQEHGQVLVFVARKSTGYKLANALVSKIPLMTVRFHNADKPQEELSRMEAEFRDGDVDVLIHTTTLVAGVDFDVTCGVIAETSTHYGTVPLYDLVQAVSRVGRRRRGFAHIVFSSEDIGREHVLTKAIQMADYGSVPTSSDVELHVASLWRTWRVMWRSVRPDEYLCERDGVVDHSVHVQQALVTRGQWIVPCSYTEAAYSMIAPITAWEIQAAFADAELWGHPSDSREHFVAQLGSCLAENVGELRSVVAHMYEDCTYLYARYQCIQGSHQPARGHVATALLLTHQDPSSLEEPLPLKATPTQWSVRRTIERWCKTLFPQDPMTRLLLESGGYHVE